MKDSVKILKKEILWADWSTLYKYTFETQTKNGELQVQSREAYDRGDGAVILLYNPKKKTVILTRQFRLPAFVNGNKNGMMIEACAGLLDKDNPEDCIRKETEEETGFRIAQVKKIFEVYMSPGSVTEILYFFVAEYSPNQKIDEGGGVGDEENIEVLELDFDAALTMMDTGEIKDAKTIMLLQYAKIKGLMVKS